MITAPKLVGRTLGDMPWVMKITTVSTNNITQSYYIMFI